MSNEELKKIVEETIVNNDPYWNEPVFNAVKKIVDLKENTEITISELINSDNKFDIKQMFEIDEIVTNVCNKINITLDKSKHIGQYIGLPFNISFVKKTLSDDIINSIPESLREHIYIHNGNIYAKQKLPVELENDFILFKNSISNNNKEYPRCKFCGAPTMIISTKDSNGGKDALVCSSCGKFQN